MKVKEAVVQKTNSPSRPASPMYGNREFCSEHGPSPNDGTFYGCFCFDKTNALKVIRHGKDSQ